MTRTVAEIRQEFIDFFRAHGHAFVPSSPVVPHDDPTLLFTNAGMNQFKPYFLGTETAKHARVANTQKCIRAGGKHNDLDDVGHDTYHHTFFEMLGNWSFGDYFKKEAIAWAWELLTKVWGLDKARLHATYFGGSQATRQRGNEGSAGVPPADALPADLEARDLWLEVTNIDPSHVHAGSAKDNFWEMGETGPCGPCSEIHIDLTPDKSGTKLVNAGDARVMEIWNLVFIQFNRAADGKLTPLPAKHVDTGMGLERVTAILQGHNNNYATDLFVPIIQAIEKISGHRYGEHGPSARAYLPPSQGGVGGGYEPGAQATDQPPSLAGRGAGEGCPLGVARYARFIPGEMRDEACRVIADHIRCLSFALTDGAVPDKEGRGYVLRRILRRAVRFGWQHLDLHEPFLWRLVDTVVDVMGEAFPELRKNPRHVKDILREEEESFDRTLQRGIEIFNSEVFHLLCEAKPRIDALDSISVYDRDSNTRFRRAWVRERSTDEPARDLVITVQENKRDELVTAFEHVPEVPGSVAFELHDTFGFPIDLTQIMAAEKGLTVDIAEYERLMEEARARARTVRVTRAPWLDTGLVGRYGPTEFVGYDQLKANAILHRAFTVEGVEGITGLQTGESGVLVLDRTPFYAEAGGQVGDRGVIKGDSEDPWEFSVEDTQKIGDTYVHFGTCVRGPIRASRRAAPGAFRGEGDPLPKARPAHWVRATAEVTESVRRTTMKNHTATHVMNWALREVLGDHVQQKGSLVDHEKTRFDFSHPRALTPEEIKRVEQLVNEKIRQNLPVSWQEVDQQQALKINGLRAVFGERYPDRVRVLSVGVSVEELVQDPANPKWREVSIEFCGGTHVRNTADIGHFVITSEEAVAKGVRRIVGVTGPAAKIVEEAGAALLLEAEELKRGPVEAVSAGLARLQSALTTAQLPVRHRPRVQALFADLQQIVKQQHKAEAADAATVVKERIADLLKAAPKIGGTTIVVAEMPDVPIEQLKHGADTIKQKCGSAAVLFGVRVGPGSEPEAPARDETPSPSPSLEGREVTAPAAPAGKAVLLAAMTPDLVKRGLKAGDLVKAIAPLVNGGGGGPPTMAQAGGKNPERLAEALAAGRKWIADRL